MLNREEKELMDSKETYLGNELPPNIDDFIRGGIETGKRKKLKKTHRRLISIAACFLCVLLITSIRISPSFASFVEGIPGLSYLVNLVQYDKGLKMAVENGFYQTVEVSDEHEGLTFTIEHIIVDESQLIIFYSIETKEDHQYVNVRSIDLFDEEGNQLPVSIAYSKEIDLSLQLEKRMEGKIEVHFSKDIIIPKNLTTKIKLEESKETRQEYRLKHGWDVEEKDLSIELEPTWELKIPIDHEKFQNLVEIYAINQVVEIEGQKIYFDRFIQHPTKTVIEFRYDENNTMKIFGFYNLGILDENGERSGTSGGFSSGWSDGNYQTVNLESRYFTRPNEIYIVADGIKALDKEMLKVSVDLDQGKMIGAYDPNIRLEEIARNERDNSLELTFGLRVEEEKRAYFPFSPSFTDATGRVFESSNYGAAGIREGTYNAYALYSLPLDKAFQNPITLEISDYPNLVKEKIKIKIK